MSAGGAGITSFVIKILRISLLHLTKEVISVELMMISTNLVHIPARFFFYILGLLDMSAQREICIKTHTGIIQKIEAFQMNTISEIPRNLLPDKVIFYVFSILIHLLTIYSIRI